MCLGRGGGGDGGKGVWVCVGKTRGGGGGLVLWAGMSNREGKTKKSRKQS